MYRTRLCNSFTRESWPGRSRAQIRSPCERSTFFRAWTTTPPSFLGESASYLIEEFLPQRGAPVEYLAKQGIYFAHMLELQTYGLLTVNQSINFGLEEPREFRLPERAIQVVPPSGKRIQLEAYPLTRPGVELMQLSKGEHDEEYFCLILDWLAERDLDVHWSERSPDGSAGSTWTHHHPKTP